MATQVKTRDHLVISPQTAKRMSGVVILSLKEYRALCERAVPTFYLKGKKAQKLDQLVKDCLREFHQGRAKKIKSLADLE